MEIYKSTIPTLSTEELNVIQVNLEGRVLYQCPTCSKPWTGEKVVDTLVQEAQKRILEKAIWRLDGEVTALPEDRRSMEYTNGYLDSLGEAIAELKSLLGEVDT
jgi:hypothetical protein